MKRIITLAIILIFSASMTMQAQDTPADSVKVWKIGGDVSLTFGQSSFVNWASGGANSFSLNGLLNFHANYEKDKVIWTNNLIMAYGMYKEKDDQRKKNDDRIDFISNFGYEMTKNWYYSLTLGFKSQFDKGYPDDNDSVYSSDWLAPSYTTLGLGFTYQPNEKLQLILSPATYRLTTVDNQRLANEGQYGVEPAVYDTAGNIVTLGKKIRNEFGFDLKFMYILNICKNVEWQTNLELFSNYLEDPQNIDVYWDNYFNFTINKWLSAQLTTSLIYDNDIIITDKDGNTGPRTQFKQTFGLGLAYKFGHQKPE
jgi:hypothetical protein